MASIAIKRDLKQAKKVSQKYLQNTPQKPVTTIDEDTTADDLSQQPQNQSARKLTKKEQYLRQEIIQDGQTYRYTEDPEGYIAARKRQQNRNSAKRSRNKQNELIVQTGKQLNQLQQINQVQCDKISQLAQEQEFSSHLRAQQEQKIIEMRSQNKTEREIIQMFANQSIVKEQQIQKYHKENQYLKQQLNQLKIQMMATSKTNRQIDTSGKCSSGQVLHQKFVPSVIRSTSPLLISTPSVIHVDGAWYTQQASSSISNDQSSASDSLSSINNNTNTTS